MYIITFYSFKGGVGRSLALANIGAHLALTGRRVLLVDFDLEAPGLDTFNQLRPHKPTKGVVDYLCDYIQTGRAPTAKDYMYECSPFSAGGGCLWVMPAGAKNQASYGERLASIDWQKLYSKQDGYLLLEDLKSQWAQDLKPDYVLVDSRTGYTDIAGICTRQLPDAVVILFFPNEQNLGGLAEIVAGVRNEATEPRKKKIQLHFVTSNVPDLDDEDQILAKRIARFKRLLDYEELAAVIHHYPSLALLNQVIFTKERPRSRLAREYRDLCRHILRYNLQDREGAISYLKTPGDADSPGMTPDLDRDLEEIRKLHKADGEILARLGSVYLRLGRSDFALDLYEEAISKGFENGRMLMERARLQLENEQKESAITGVERILALSSAQIAEVTFAVRLLLKLAPHKLQELPLSTAFSSLPPPEQLSVAQELLTNRDLLPILEGVIQKISSESCTDSSGSETFPWLVEYHNPLILCLIGQRKFNEAMNAISATTPVPANMEVEDAFNYGMAAWGATGKIPTVFFGRVVECDAASRLEDDLNRLQCAALTYWIVGNAEEARARISEAREILSARPRPAFSCWRYLQVTPRDFKKDLESMQSMFDGSQIVPDVFFLSSADESLSKP